MAKSKQKKQYKIKGRLQYFTPDRWNSFSTKENPKYEVQLTNIEEFPENKEILQAFKILGAATRKQDRAPEWGETLTGRSNYPIPTIDAKKNPIPKDLGIGNGSIAYVLFELYPTPNSNHSEYGFGPRKVQILELVEYEKTDKDSKADDIFGEEDGFAAEVSEEDEAPFNTQDDDLDDDIEL